MIRAALANNNVTFLERVEVICCRAAAACNIILILRGWSLLNGKVFSVNGTSLLVSKTTFGQEAARNGFRSASQSVPALWWLSCETESPVRETESVFETIWLLALVESTELNCCLIWSLVIDLEVISSLGGSDSILRVDMVLVILRAGLKGVRSIRSC